MTSLSDNKRPICAACLRPQQTCICSWITPTACSVEILILQHPLEVHSAKGSARLLHLSLPGSQLAVGEVFDAEQLHALLHASRQGEGGTSRHAVLLYPDTPDGGKDGMPVPPALAMNALQTPSHVRLVILDGTWRKSRKMLYLNPLLQSLPRLSLADAPPSQYRIRKAHRPDQLSTLEATCHALMQLERDEGKYRPLLDAFDGFVAQQAAWFKRSEE